MPHGVTADESVLLATLARRMSSDPSAGPAVWAGRRIDFLSLPGG